MDIGKINNLLIWVNKKHPKPVRINDYLLTIDETKELISLLQKTLIQK